MASLKSPSLVLDASAVVRIIEGSPQAATFQQAVLEAELVLAHELMPLNVRTRRLFPSLMGSIQAGGSCTLRR